MSKLLGEAFKGKEIYPLLCRELEEQAITLFSKSSSMGEGQEMQEALYMLYFLGIGLQIMPASVGTNLCSHFFTLLESGCRAITIPTYINIETFMAGQKLPIDFVEHVLKFLLENTPSTEQSGDNDVLHIAYIQSLVQTMLNLHKSETDDTKIKLSAKYMPAFVLNLGELLAYITVRVSRAAFNGLQTIINQCITPDFFTKKAKRAKDDVGIEELELTEGAENKEMTISLLAQTIANLKYLLTQRFEQVAPDVYKLIGFFAEKLKYGLVPECSVLIRDLIEGKEYYLCY